MTKIRMNKEMPITISVEWAPQSAYMHNSSLDHLLPGDRNQHDLVFVKEDVEFFENALSSQSVQNKTVCLQVSPKEKEIKQENSCSDAPVILCQTESSNRILKKLADISKRYKIHKGSIDIIEMSVESASDYKYLFVYEDQPSKYIVLKALRNNTAKEVATKLLDVLAIIGAPRVLQSGNGRKFAEQVVHELRLLWNHFLILHGEAPKYEVSRRDFKSLLESWMRKNSAKIWCEGLNFVQIHQNTTYRCQNDKVPCDILFGRNVCEKFKNLRIEKEMENLWTEEEWIEYLSSKRIEDVSATTEDAHSISDINHCEASESREDTRYQNASPRNDSISLINVKNETLASNTMDSVCIDETNVNSGSKTNEDTQSLKCKYCQKQYMKLWHLKNHMRTHKTEQSGVFRCKLCSKTFSVSRLCEKHMKQSHGLDKSADKEEEESVSRNTRSNTEALTAVFNKERSETRATHEGSDPEAANENCDASLNAKDTYGRAAKSSKQTGRRRLPTVGRPSKIQSALQCKYCKQKFSFPSVLERHMRSHTNERPYVCHVCNKSFKQLGHLSQHSLTHHDYRSFQCRVCGVKFESLDSLKQHAHSHRSDGTTATTAAALKIRDVYRLFECDSCKKVFTTKSVLERHIFTHTQERQYDCKVCGKRFKQAGHVKSHMLVHTGERRFQCTVCSKRFSLSNSLKKHMYVHNGEKPYQCDVCGARFLEKRNLNGHLLTHTNERPYCCKICGKRYTLADTLRRHVSAAHEDGRTYQCEICAKMFKQLAHLSVHKKVHNDERPFQCHLCEKNFKHKNVLKSHLAIHANVRPFECDDCKATFVRKTNLQTHILSAHMNERPYTCTICGKRFKQISHLNGHVIVHSNLMPYKCDYCDRRCNRLDNLKKHMRLHTKNKE